MRGLHLDFDPRRRVEYLPARHGPEPVPSDQSAFRFCWTTANRWGGALNGRSSENDGMLDVPVNGAVIAVLSVTIDCDAKRAICTEDGRPLSEWLELTVSGRLSKSDGAAVGEKRKRVRITCNYRFGRWSWSPGQKARSQDPFQQRGTLERTSIRPYYPGTAPLNPITPLPAL